MKDKLGFRYLSFFLFVVTSWFLFGISSQFNLGISSDSTVYIEGAESILEKGTYEDENGKFISHFPPLYSSILAIVTKIVSNGDIMLAGRLLNAVILGLFIGFLASLLKRRIQKSWILVLSILFVICSKFSTIFLWQMTEGLFVLFINIQFWLWEKKKTSFKGQHSIWFLLGVISGFSVLLRFAGFFIVGWWLLVGIYSYIKTQTRVIHLFTYILGGGLVLLPWFLYVKLLGVTATGRMLMFHPPDLQKFLELLNTILCWFSYYNILTLIFFFFLFVLGFLLLRMKISAILKSDYTLNFYFLFTLFYVVFIVVSFTFFDAHIQFDNRIFSPVFVPLLLVLVDAIRKLVTLDRDNQGRFTMALSIGLFAIWGSQMINGINQYALFYREGLGYSSKRIKDSQTIGALKRLEFSNVYTNFPQLLKLHVDCDACVYGTPIKFSTNSGLQNTTYENEVASMLKRVLAGGGVILIFKDSSRDFYFSEKDLNKLNADKYLNNQLMILDFNDGLLIYKT